MIIDNQLLETYILPRVERPAQYVGGETHSLVKEWPAAPATMVFAFPDSYEVGMSHLGGRLLYEAINNHSPHLCERVFMPLPDMRDLLRSTHTPLFSLESRHELRDFDVIGFTLQYELSYTNILAMLDLANIPLLSADRGDGCPLIIAGGPCAYNPEPLADIVDLFVIGEGEDLDREVLDLAAEGKRQGWSRQELLEQMAAIPGVYAPRFYIDTYDAEGNFLSLSLKPDAPPAAPARIMKRVLPDMDQAIFPDKPILPLIRPIHDRVMLELMRGCTHGCRFCQAGIIYRPRREKSVDVLADQARTQLAASGYDDVALLSLSSADYTCIEPLMNRLLAEHAPSRVGLSLPSLRVDAFSVELAGRTQEVRKSGITLAPEAGSPRLRDVINKGVTELDIMSAARAAFSQGYTHIKLYFMLGLPYETDGDILAIADLCKRIIQEGRRVKPTEVKKPLRLTLGVANFVPKCATPFQWQGQCPVSELKRKQDLLREAIRPLRQATLNCHDCRASLLEAAFARGDRRLGRVLIEAYARGCMLDGWSEHFRPEAWREAFVACGLTEEQFAQAQPIFGRPLPWSHISCGVSEEWLWRENIRAGRSELTADCSHGECSGCGVCRDELQPRLLARPAAQGRQPRTLPDPPVEQRKYRLCLAVRPPVSWLSHLDLLAAMEKALRRSGLPLAFSQGFNPHVQLSWGPAHPVGLESAGEYVDIILAAPAGQDWRERLAAALPAGLTLVSAREVELGAPSLMAAINYAAYRWSLPDALPEDLDAAIAAFLGAKRVVAERVTPKGRKEADIRPAVAKLERQGQLIIAEAWLDRGAALRIPELARILAPASRLEAAERSGLFIRQGEQLLLP